MGIRVHKCIGYGLTDVKVKDYEISDPRFNPMDFDEMDKRFSLKEWAGIIKRKSNEEKDKYDAERVRESIEPGERWHLPKTFRDLIFANTAIQDMLKKKTRIGLHDLIFFQPEFGIKNVVLFSPLNFHNYNRYDDLIDWCEERGRGMKAKVNVLKFPIYPFETYMDKRNGERISHDAYSWMQHHKGKDSVLVPAEFYEGNTIRTLGEARKNIKPGVPADVIEFCEYMNVFKDRNTVYSLKPMIYTYWC